VPITAVVALAGLAGVWSGMKGILGRAQGGVA